jgi:hypothetical protein
MAQELPIFEVTQSRSSPCEPLSLSAGLVLKHAIGSKSILRQTATAQNVRLPEYGSHLHWIQISGIRLQLEQPFRRRTSTCLTYSGAVAFDFRRS